MKGRADKSNLPFAPPYMPQSLLDLLSHLDPDSAAYTSSDPSENPYFGKKILVLHGEKDELVPWECCRTFVEGLQVGEKGIKEVFIEQDRGHETSSLMVSELVKWVVRYGIRDA
jgi:predicted esterase